ncbi:hypothetical protein ILUMI_26167 [Ignelater luminosus]|uniref:Luciferin 4-monooxygenase n=1 Tax=Ignelater luminosus TaxID=2038154 RepID=A0A8K0C709_IGNLU|nr:hypothetical protein ILUMI_26167 [Ignelater luminosus]
MEEKYVLHGPKSWKLPEISVGEYIYNNLLQYTDIPVALADAQSGEIVSYKILLETTRHLAIYLKKFGLLNQPGNVVGIFSENNLSYFYPVLASLYLGVTVTTFNPQYTPDELSNVLNISKPTVIFCSEWTLDTLLEVTQQFAFIKTILIINTKEESVNGVKSLNYILSNDLALNTPDFKPTKIDSTDQTAIILYSSGTTGLPKGVMLTHKNIHYLLSNMADPRYVKQYEPGSNTVTGILPFFHFYGFAAVFTGLTVGRKTVVMQSFDPEVYLSIIQNYKVKTLPIVPPLANFLAKSPLVDNYDLSSLETILCGAAPLSKRTQDILIKRLKPDRFLQGYGLTEAVPILTFTVDDFKTGSCGKVCPGMSVKIVDPESGKALGPGQNGELCCKGDTVMKGYANNIEATKAIFDKDGWLHTGDVAYYDSDGYFYIVDRIKELIKYKGFQVPPAELEAILLTHPKIIDAGVVGLPDEVAGELPVAFVVTDSDENLTEEEVKNFIAKKVSPQKHLHGGVKFVDEIPRNPSGKILRRKLQELLRPQKCKL